jgi:hypothetical protein
MRIEYLYRYRLAFNTAEEMKFIAKFLRDNDFEVHNYFELMVSKDIGKWRCFKWNEENENFNRSTKTDVDNLITFNKLIETFDLDWKGEIGRKKILKPDIDPYGEEKWGYIKELNYWDNYKNNIGYLFIDDENMYDRALMKLDSMGFLWKSGNNAMKKCVSYRNEMALIIYFKEKRFAVMEQWIVDRTYEIIPPEKFFNKKINKIKNLEADPFDEENWGYVQEKNNNKKMITEFKLFEKQYDPMVGEYYQIKYFLTGDLVPVKIIKRNSNNTYLVSFDVEGSIAKGAPEASIKNSDIISPYQPIRNPVGSGFVSANTNMNTQQKQVSNDMYL